MVKVIFYLEIIAPAPRLILLEPGREVLFRRLIGRLESPVQFRCPAGIHITERVHIQPLQDLLRGHRHPESQLFRHPYLDVLHDPVGQVVPAEIRVPVLIGCLDADMVCHPVVTVPETACTQVCRPAPTVYDQRLVLRVLLQLTRSQHPGDGAVQDRHALVKHLPVLRHVLRQDPVEQLLEQELLPDRAGHMDLAHPAFETVFRCPDDIQDKCPDDLPAREERPPALPVRDLLLPVGVTDPPLHVIEDAETLVDIACTGQLCRLLTEHETRFSMFYRDHACHGRHQPAAAAECRILDRILLKIFRKGHPPGLLEIPGIQTDARRSAGGAEIDGKRHPQLHGAAYFHVHERDPVSLDPLRHVAARPVIQGKDPVRVLLPETVQVVLLQIRFPARHPFLPHHIQPPLLSGYCLQVEDAADLLRSADKERVGVRKLPAVRYPHPVLRAHGQPLIHDEL